MGNKRPVFRIPGHEFQWMRQKTLNLCTDCVFHMPGPFADCCEASTTAFNCNKEEYGAWQEASLGK